MEYFFNAQDGAHERFIDVPDGPVEPVVLIIGLAYQHMLNEGLKEGYLFEAGEAHWFVKLVAP